MYGTYVLNETTTNPRAKEQVLTGLIDFIIIAFHFVLNMRWTLWLRQPVAEEWKGECIDKPTETNATFTAAFLTQSLTCQLVCQLH